MQHLLATRLCARHRLFYTPSAPLRVFSRVLHTSLPISNAVASAPPPTPTAPAGPGGPLGLVMRSLPPALVPYAQLVRFDKPVGTFLLYWPGAWGITMAAATTGASVTSTAGTLALFGIGALIMRGAGCVVNDLWDRELDRKVSRTATRPLAAGTLTATQAMACLTTQLFAGLGVLVSLPKECFLLGAVSLAPVAAYPVFKRFTHYPQLMLALTYNWGALLGFPAMSVALNADIAPTMLSLYAAGVCWTMVYDTIYAHQDKTDDVKVGIKSTALAWGSNSKAVISGFATAQVGLLAGVGMLNALGPAYFVGIAWAAARLGRMIYAVDLDKPADCWKWFVDNIKTGGVIFLAFVGEYIYRMFKSDEKEDEEHKE
ncbi:UbiA prenyltransferase family-domain-containing protein [Limtongia smithiae]|uniref:UbiA prenyltransferase family-domain-containing protein n=1 Tax=Limtongia smithiae TaxID=1125753 RepID=UPI0034CE3BA7